MWTHPGDTRFGRHCDAHGEAVVASTAGEGRARLAAVNIVKHGVTFGLVAIGASARGRVLYVVHVERGTRDRIISARTANQAEVAAYQQVTR